MTDEDSIVVACFVGLFGVLAFVLIADAPLPEESAKGASVVASRWPNGSEAPHGVLRLEMLPLSDEGNASCGPTRFNLVAFALPTNFNDSRESLAGLSVPMTPCSAPTWFMLPDATAYVYLQLDGKGDHETAWHLLDLSTGTWRTGIGEPPANVTSLAPSNDMNARREFTFTPGASAT